MLCPSIEWSADQQKVSLLFYIGVCGNDGKSGANTLNVPENSLSVEVVKHNTGIEKHCSFNCSQQPSGCRQRLPGLLFL